MKPVYEQHSKVINYTVMNRVVENHEKTINYTVMVPVTETKERTVTYNVTKPVNYTKTIQVKGGHWDTVTEEVPGPVVRKVTREPGTWSYDPCTCKCVLLPR